MAEPLMIALKWHFRDKQKQLKPCIWKANMLEIFKRNFLWTCAGYFYKVIQLTMRTNVKQYYGFGSLYLYNHIVQSNLYNCNPVKIFFSLWNVTNTLILSKDIEFITATTVSNKISCWLYLYKTDIRFNTELCSVLQRTTVKSGLFSEELSTNL